MIIGIVRFWQIFVIDLIGNLTGTSLTTFTLCAIELMLAGLCVSIPMFRPFYLRWRAKHRSTQGSHGKATYASSRSGIPGGSQRDQGHMAWIELVSRSDVFSQCKANVTDYNHKDHDGSNDDDSGSQRKLTTGKPDAIHVTQDWSVTTKN